MRLLRTLGFGPVDFPMTLIKRERPDFLLTINGCEIGVGHTEGGKALDEQLAKIGKSMYAEPATGEL